MMFSDKDNFLSRTITASIAGDSSALEALIKHNQDYIYNIVLKFIGDHHDAEDAVQEILVKMITNLSSFRMNSSFNTWLYRIAVNHVLNMKRSKHEELFTSFEDHKKFIENLPDISLNGFLPYSEEKWTLMQEETKIQCQMGMLLCLDRYNRIVFILGGILGMDSKTGAAVMEITPENFRKRLSRSRKSMSNYMNRNCSLINPHGTCSCKKKTKRLIEQGLVNPEDSRFHSTYIEKIKMHVMKYSEHADDILQKRVENSFREHPWITFQKSLLPLKKIIRNIEFSWDEIGLR